MPKRIEHKFDENGVELKWCGRCKQFKPLSEFAKHSGKWDGLQERCTSCRKQQYLDQGKETAKKYRKNNPELIKAIQRRSVIKSYGITEEDYTKMLEQQDHKCAICGTSDWGRPSPCIDHDHITGEVRALLCNRCNRVLGFVEDNPELVTKIFDYLKIHGK